MKRLHAMSRLPLSTIAGFTLSCGLFAQAQAAPPAPQALLAQHSCTACHAQDQKIVGPSFNDIAQKYAGKAAYLEGKIKSGSTGVWGNLSMPPQSAPNEDIRTIAAWLANGMK
jgi:S-disulfanyl-L-cysteine oxidoreductase SoxD